LRIIQGFKLFNKAVIMKKLLAIFVILSSLLVMPVSAFWGKNNNNVWSDPYSNPYSNLNPYDVWDPRYWKEELEQIFDNKDYWGNNNYNNYNNGYGGYRNNPYRNNQYRSYTNGYNRNYNNQFYNQPNYNQPNYNQPNYNQPNNSQPSCNQSNKEPSK
jgi:hypothetical protein